MHRAGSGPGPQTEDGCSVEVYRHLPYLGELEPLLKVLPECSSILELGCGAGRLTQVLQRAGFEVTSVDSSREMLAYNLWAADKHQCQIEQLRIAKRFDAVLLASNLINTPDQAQRSAILHAAARHLKRNGVCYCERHLPELAAATESKQQSKLGGYDVIVQRVAKNHNVLSLKVQYQKGDSTWSHAFDTELLSEEQVNTALRQAGFSEATWIDRDRKWFQATLDLNYRAL